ncbi:MAG: hypothetical protein R2769_09920 [Saprospiraceae bacterium]
MIKRPVKMDATSIVAVKDGYVRFSEVDSLHMVWHGTYTRSILKTGERHLGCNMGWSYLQVHEHGFVTPIVKAVCDYKEDL